MGNHDCKHHGVSLIPHRRWYAHGERGASAAERAARGVEDAPAQNLRDAGCRDTHPLKTAKGGAASDRVVQKVGQPPLDYAGFIPGEGLVHSLFGIGLGMVSMPLSAANGDTTGALGGIAGIHLSALELTGSKAIRWISYPLNFAQTVKDNKNIEKDYHKCMSGGG